LHHTIFRGKRSGNSFAESANVTIMLKQTAELIVSVVGGAGRVGVGRESACPAGDS